MMNDLKLLLQGEYASVKDLVSAVRTGLTHLGIPCPDHISYWQYATKGQTVGGQYRDAVMRYGVHVTLVVDGGLYQFDRGCHGLRVTQIRESGPRARMCPEDFTCPLENAA